MVIDGIIIFLYILFFSVSNFCLLPGLVHFIVFMRSFGIADEIIDFSNRAAHIVVVVVVFR